MPQPPTSYGDFMQQSQDAVLRAREFAMQSQAQARGGIYGAAMMGNPIYAGAGGFTSQLPSPTAGPTFFASDLGSRLQSRAMMMGDMFQGFGGPQFSPMQQAAASLGIGVHAQGFSQAEMQVYGQDIIMSNLRRSGQTMARQGLTEGLMAGGGALMMFGGAPGMVAGGAMIAGGMAAPGIMRASGFDYWASQEALTQGLHQSIRDRTAGGMDMPGGVVSRTIESVRGVAASDEVGAHIRMNQGGFFGIDAEEFGKLQRAATYSMSDTQIDEMVKGGGSALVEGMKSMQTAAENLNISFGEIEEISRNIGQIAGGYSQLEEVTGLARKLRTQSGLSRQVSMQLFGQGLDLGRSTGIGGEQTGQNMMVMASQMKRQYDMGTLGMNATEFFMFGGKNESEAAANWARASMQANIAALKSPYGDLMLLNQMPGGAAGGDLMTQMAGAGGQLARDPLSLIKQRMSQEALQKGGQSAQLQMLNMIETGPLAAIFNKPGDTKALFVAEAMKYGMAQSEFQAGGLYEQITGYRSTMRERLKGAGVKNRTEMNQIIQNIAGVAGTRGLTGEQMVQLNQRMQQGADPDIAMFAMEDFAGREEALGGQQAILTRIANRATKEGILRLTDADRAEMTTETMEALASSIIDKKGSNARNIQIEEGQTDLLTRGAVFDVLMNPDLSIDIDAGAFSDTGTMRSLVRRARKRLGRNVVTGALGERFEAMSRRYGPAFAKSLEKIGIKIPAGVKGAKRAAAIESAIGAGMSLGYMGGHGFLGMANRGELPEEAMSALLESLSADPELLRAIEGEGAATPGTLDAGELKKFLTTAGEGYYEKDSEEAKVLKSRAFQQNVGSAVLEYTHRTMVEANLSRQDDNRNVGTNVRNLVEAALGINGGKGIKIAE